MIMIVIMIMMMIMIMIGDSGYFPEITMQGFSPVAA